MRLVRWTTVAAPFGAVLMLGACGHSDPGPPTLSVTCDGSLMLAGAASVTASPSGTGDTTLSFPDPANPGQTGTLPIQSGRACIITPVVATPAKDEPAITSRPPRRTDGG